MNPKDTNRTSDDHSEETRRVGIFEWGQWKTVATVVLVAAAFGWGAAGYFGYVSASAVLAAQAIHALLLFGVWLVEV